ncbi:MAG: hypothetical protein H8D34_05700 [Chloroflexi bacterium]|nr:hypothetical protein [Chloroflexota bacterium]
MLLKHPRSSRRSLSVGPPARRAASGMACAPSAKTRRKYKHTKKFFVILVYSPQARIAFVDSLLKAKLWEGVKTIAALIVALALLAFSCWLNVYWCFGWC